MQKKETKLKKKNRKFWRGEKDGKMKRGERWL